jgi:hypothetical protein
MTAVMRSIFGAAGSGGQPALGHGFERRLEAAVP